MDKNKEELGEELYDYIYMNHYGLILEDTVDLSVVQKFLDDGADINYKVFNDDDDYRKIGYINALQYHFDDLVLLKFLLEKGIDYEYYLNDDYNKHTISFKYLKKHHEAKLLKDKLEKDLNCDKINKVRLNKI